jgi:hypothetical protein
MMSPFRKYTVLALATALFIGGSWLQRSHAQTTILGPVTTTVSVGTAAILAALPSNPTRRAVIICNGHATNTATFTTGTITTPVNLTTGVVLQTGNVASSCFQLGSMGFPAGSVGAQINVIASATSTPVTFVEFF